MHQPRDGAERGRLAGAVGPDESDLQPPLLPVGKVARVLIGLLSDADEPKELHRFLADPLFFSALPRQLEQGVPDLGLHAHVASDAHVVEAGHVVEEPDVLEGASDAPSRDLVGLRPGDVTAVENDSSAGWRKKSGQNVEEGRLAGTVRPDQGEDLSSLDVEADVVDRNQAAEALGQVGQLEDVVGGLLAHDAWVSSTTASSSWTAACFNSCSRTRLGRMPCGRSSIIPTRIAP